MGLFDDSLPDFTTTTGTDTTTASSTCASAITTPPFSFDDHLWTEEDNNTLGGPQGDDFDWTALGLDCFGTQLLQPGLVDTGLESQQQQQQQNQQDLDLLFGVSSSGNDMAVSALDNQPMTLESVGDHLFTNFSTSPQPHSHHSHSNPSPAIHTPAIHHDNSASTSPSHSSHSEHNSSSSGTKTKRGAANISGEEEEEDEETSVKRQRNTQAARRYRQRRLDRLADLEKKLADMTSERDDLRVKLARREAEVGALREVLTSSKK